MCDRARDFLKHCEADYLRTIESKNRDFCRCCVYNLNKTEAVLLDMGLGKSKNAIDPEPAPEVTAPVAVTEAAAAAAAVPDVTATNVAPVSEVTEAAAAPIPDVTATIVAPAVTEPATAAAPVAVTEPEPEPVATDSVSVAVPEAVTNKISDSAFSDALAAAVAKAFPETKVEGQKRVITLSYKVTPVSYKINRKPEETRSEE